MLRNRKGFTLIELLIVVVIIGILAAIAIPKFAATKDKAKLAAVKSDLRTLQTAEEAYFSDSASYTTASNLVTKGLFSLSAGNTVLNEAATAGGYNVAIQNVSISTPPTSCHVEAGTSAASSAVDGVIQCP